jgi:hypothetical protein
LAIFIYGGAGGDDGVGVEGGGGGVDGEEGAPADGEVDGGGVFGGEGERRRGRATRSGRRHVDRTCGPIVTCSKCMGTCPQHTQCNHCALSALGSLRPQCPVLCHISALSAQCTRVL